MSQVQVEDLTGITQGHISAIERETRTPSLDVLNRLASTYRLSDEQRGTLGAAALAQAARPRPTQTEPAPSPE